MVEIRFRISAKTKTESVDEGTVYRVRLKSKEGHALILVSKDERTFHGYVLGETVPVQLQNPQKTLETSP